MILLVFVVTNALILLKFDKNRRHEREKRSVTTIVINLTKREIKFFCVTHNLLAA